MLIFIQPAHAIKIGLITGVESVRLGASTYANIINSRTNHKIYTLDPMRNYEFKAYGTKVIIKIAGKYYNLDSDEVAIRSTNGGFVSAKNKWYRGIFKRGCSVRDAF